MSNVTMDLNQEKKEEVAHGTESEERDSQIIYFNAVLSQCNSNRLFITPQERNQLMLLLSQQPSSKDNHPISPDIKKNENKGEFMTTNDSKRVTESKDQKWNSEENMGEMYISYAQLKKVFELGNKERYKEACEISAKVRNETSLNPKITCDTTSNLVIIQWLIEGPECQLNEDKIVIKYPKNSIVLEKEKSGWNEVCDQLIEWLNFEIINGSAQIVKDHNETIPNNIEKKEKGSHSSELKNQDGLNVNEEEKAKLEKTFVNFTFH